MLTGDRDGPGLVPGLVKITSPQSSPCPGPGWQGAKNAGCSTRRAGREPKMQDAPRAGLAGSQKCKTLHVPGWRGAKNAGCSTRRRMLHAPGWHLVDFCTRQLFNASVNSHFHPWLFLFGFLRCFLFLVYLLCVCVFLVSVFVCMFVPCLLLLGCLLFWF